MYNSLRRATFWTRKFELGTAAQAPVDTSHAVSQIQELVEVDGNVSGNEHDVRNEHVTRLQ